MMHLPGPVGLYDPINEHDACGVAFVVDMHGRRSRDIVEKAITALVNRRARRDLARIEAMGLAHLPVCVAKTQFSFTADSKRRGAPDGFSLPVTRLIPCAGAGFIVAMAGSIMRMPGLSKSPQALRIDMQDDRISGLA